MSHLIALIFEDPWKEEEARAALHSIASEGLSDVKDTVLIQSSSEGKISVKQEDQVIGKGQKAGHIMGLIAGAVTGTMPFVPAGTLGGRLVSRLMDHGITRKFIRSMKSELGPGKSALIVSGDADPGRRQAIVEHLQGFGAKILESDITADVLEGIEREIALHRAA